MLIPKGALVVSCQARADNPLHGAVYMSAMARAAEAGGAKGIRANGEEDIAAIRAVTDLPIIGIAKIWDDRFPVISRRDSRRRRRSQRPVPTSSVSMRRNAPAMVNRWSA
jgi:hypothetical protein